MHRLAYEDSYIYECLLNGNSTITTKIIRLKIETMIDKMIDQNSIILLEAPDISSDVLDANYFNLLDVDEIKAYENFYAARLLSAKEFVTNNDLCDAVYELIYAFDDKEKIKQHIKNLII
ncbi:hypothetical protein [Bartonella sp. HY761]|uniref:hypothetical protein n=1 Tax=Bartonella sp. HY761 TaxID=2979330 RepID=UPI0022010C18|nr:hypothetical protein [Bartonella sp. HY761]UXN08009.1 hypothetical protein N6A79_14620 [Bartonella sp. HY761]